MATAIVTGAIATALLAVLGSLLNFGDIGRLVWLFAVVMLINAGIAAYGRYLRLKLGLPAEKNRGSGCPSNRT